MISRKGSRKTKTKKLKTMTEKRIIGLAGRKYSGKGMLADILVKRYQAEVLSCASSLKELVMVMLNADDLEVLNAWKNSDTSVYRPISSDDVIYLTDQTGIPVEKIREECDKIQYWRTVRQMLQFIGTDIIRKYKPTWHVDKLVEKINGSTANVVVVDDVRFPNEKAAIENLGGKCFFVIRPTMKNISNHESETSLLWQDFTESRIIINQYSKHDMQNNFYKCFEDDFFLCNENQIFLSSHPNYMEMNVRFGTDVGDMPLAMSILTYDSSNRNCMVDGIIEYTTRTSQETHEFLQKVCGNLKCHEDCPERFSFYNPLILENLKLYAE